MSPNQPSPQTYKSIHTYIHICTYITEIQNYIDTQIPYNQNPVKGSKYIHMLVIVSYYKQQYLVCCKHVVTLPILFISVIRNQKALKCIGRDTLYFLFIPLLVHQAPLSVQITGWSFLCNLPHLNTVIICK